MAKRTVVQIVDDFDGTLIEGHETVSWSLDGRAYEFDTSTDRATEFRTLLGPYQQVSRKSALGRRVSNNRNTRTRTHTRAVRDWAQSHGYDVSARGRIPAAIHDAFTAAQQ